MTTAIEPRILRIADVIELTNLSRSTIYTLMREGRFVSPVKLGGNSRILAWRRADIDRWIDSRPQ